MLSKTEIVTNYILSQINQGIWQAGSRIPSQQQLVRRFACSRTTVERAVSGLIDCGILTGCRGSGTFVRNRVREIKRQKVAVVAPFPKDHFRFHPFMEMFTDLNTSGLAMQLISFEHFQEHFSEYLDGSTIIVAALPYPKQLMWYEYLRRNNVPVLMINRFYENFDYICSDTDSIMREGLSWLIGKAGKDIAMITRSPNMSRPYLTDRIILFYELCLQLDIKLKPELIFRYPFPPEPEKELMEICRNLFKHQEHPRAITMLECDMVPYFIKCADAYGKTCGEDFYIFTIDASSKKGNVKGVGAMCQLFSAFSPEIEHWIDHILSGKKEPFARLVKARLAT